MRSALFWDIKERTVRVPSFNFLTFEDGTDRFSRNVGKELLLYAA